MKQVVYDQNGDRYDLSTPNVVLVLGGRPWNHTVFPVGPDTFEQLRKENPDVEFVERPSK